MKLLKKKKAEKQFYKTLNEQYPRDKVVYTSGRRDAYIFDISKTAQRLNSSWINLIINDINSSIPVNFEIYAVDGPVTNGTIYSTNLPRGYFPSTNKISQIKMEEIGKLYDRTDFVTYSDKSADIPYGKGGMIKLTGRYPIDVINEEKPNVVFYITIASDHGGYKSKNEIYREHGNPRKI